MANLMDYETAEMIREATPGEVAKSDRAAEIDGGVGAFEIEIEIDGEMVTVYGATDSAEDEVDHAIANTRYFNIKVLG